MMTAMTPKRSYQSQLRQEQAAATRARIVEAAAASVLPWANELSFEEVAAAVPVSVRTVYRYFPSQRDLLAAVRTHLEEDSGWDPDEVRADTLGAATRRVYASLGRYLGTRSGRTAEMEDALRATRAPDLTVIEREIGPLTEGMDPELARGVMAVFSGLVHMRFLTSMHQHWGLDGEQAGRAVEWAINALLDDLHRRR
jgi:AcrR family transcriptional regulator